MREIANLSRERREELVLTTSRKIGLPEAMVEKDFWVCWTLDYLLPFEQPQEICCPACYTHYKPLCKDKRTNRHGIFSAANKHLPYILTHSRK